MDLLVANANKTNSKWAAQDNFSKKQPTPEDINNYSYLFVDK